MKKISSWRTVNDIVITLIVLSVFNTICIFLDVYNVYKPSKKFCTCEKTNVSLNKKNTQQGWKKFASLSTRRCQSWATSVADIPGVQCVQWTPEIEKKFCEELPLFILFSHAADISLNTAERFLLVCSSMTTGCSVQPKLNTGCFTIVETKRLGTNPGF